MNHKLSIIIPCYNCQDTLKEAVESCYNQGFSVDEFEIVMVDDASTDDSRAVMESLAAKHENIRTFFHEINQGGGAARNTAIQNTKADVIFCLDSDDILPHRTMEKMYAFLKKEGCDAVTIHHSINFNGADIRDVNHLVTMAYIGEIIPFEALFQKEGKMCGLYQVFMFTKKAFARAGGYPTHHAFDTQGFAWRFLSAGLTAKVCPNAFYLLRINYHDSYYVREYNQGKINHNWQAVLMEHIDLFSDQVQDLIRNFGVSDFTKSLYNEVCSQDNILAVDYREKIGGSHQPKVGLHFSTKNIRRNSLSGIYLRAIHKIKSWFLNQ